MTIPDFSDIQDAKTRISKPIHHTPVLQSTMINELCGCRLNFKCENFQKTGAFKYRGATNAILKLSRETLQQGVCTHSSGNHAQALSLAAKLAGAKAYIVMPETAPKNKIAAVKNYGADIYFCKPTLAAREEKLSEIQAKTGAHFIHPYDNPDIIAGQGTAALELLETYPDIETIIAPVGGGGLMSGTSITAKHINPHINIIGAEPAGADDAKQSFYAGKLIPSVNPETIADGLLTSLSKRTFSILSKNMDDILTCKEDYIKKAIKLIFERMKIVVEPSAAVPLGIILEHKAHFKNRHIGLIVSGGNIAWPSNTLCK
ncbi:MAG: pyridoxal-phosphate dependent enzyme [Bacteroidales bacterium]